MFAAFGAAWDEVAERMGWSNPADPDVPRPTSYYCRSCDVYGTCGPDESPQCWCCGADDDLKEGTSPGVAGHRCNPMSGMYEGRPIEEVASLVG